MPKSVPHSFFPVFYTLWIHFVYFIIVCVEKCILHRERKEMCKIRVPVRKTWKVRDRRRGRKNVGGWREREGGEILDMLFHYGYLIFTNTFIIIITI